MAWTFAFLVSDGTEHARAADMCAHRVEDLVVSQLVDDLGKKIHAITATGPAFEDRGFRNQLLGAASSATRNIAEGFGRYRHREFAHFLIVARGSLLEIVDHLRDGTARGYWTEPDVRDLRGLCHRTIAAVTAFVRYLMMTQEP